MSLYLGSEKVENVTAQITLPVEPSDDLPLADGTASAGVSKKFSRADHVHPAQKIPVQSVNGKTGAVSLTASDVSAIPSTLTGTAGQVLTKTADGQEWADAPVDEKSVLLKSADVSLPTSAQWRQVIYGNGKFIAVAYTPGVSAYSEDGIHWTQFTMRDDVSWIGIACNDQKFVAINSSLSPIFYSTSANGLSWEQANVTATSKDLMSAVAYGNGKFIALAAGTNGNKGVAYATNAMNWDYRFVMPVQAQWKSIAYGNGKFVAVAYNSSITAYSADGLNWTQATLPSQNTWMSVTYGGNKFVAVAEEEIAYSVDGVNWVLKDSPISGQLTCVTYGDGKFVAAIDNSAYAIYSTNGVKWEISRITPDSIHQSWRSVTYGKGKFVAIADSSDIIAYSRDGINWYYDTVPVFQYPNGTDVGEQVKVALQIVEPDVPQPSNKNPLASGATASAGTSTEYARGDHNHPSEVFICNITQSGSTYTCDKTLSEIQAAYNSGKICIAKNNQHNYYLASISVQGMTFITIEDKKSCQFSIRSDNTVNYSETTLATPPNARKVTLTTSGWSNNQQTVTCTGVSASATNQEIRVMPADASKTSAYISCGVSCVAQARSKLTFACDKVPTTAIDVYVVMQSLNFQS